MSKFEVNSFQIPNALVDEIMAELSGTELKCYLFIVRKTKGWQKEKDAISISQFVEATKLSRSIIIVACQKLVDLGLVCKEQGKRNISIFSIPTSPKTEPVQKLNQSKKQYSTSPKTEHTKDTLTKDTPINNIKESDSFKNETIKNFIEHRKKLRKPATERAIELVLKKAIECHKLKLCKEPDEIVDLIIEKGWQSIEVEWVRNLQGKSKTKESWRGKCFNNQSIGGRNVENYLKADLL